MKKTYPCFTGFMTRAIFCYVPEEFAVTALSNEKQWDQPEKLVLRKDITISGNVSANLYHWGVGVNVSLKLSKKTYFIFGERIYPYSSP